MAGPVASGVLTFFESGSKKQAIASAIAAGGSGSLLLLGLNSEGMGRRNHMMIENGAGHMIKLQKVYLHWGKMKQPPTSVIQHQHQDECLFHAAGGWAISGSSGIVTYQLDDDTYLHIMWDCPISFDFSDNFVGLYLCGKEEREPVASLFKTMYQDIPNPKMMPEKGSCYDLVCCGPGDGTYLGDAGETRTKTWGVRRPCEVRNEKFYVTMTMGDRHETSSKVTILGKEFWPKF
ncbi:uncharacterized protein LOC135198143 [Macrobrachium nipponense]|uniref:uncharacterized protein LOC135198143 n=1 Tax=Macrobrachium nipponense TaxID=159736 RepID=UPI0030C87F59